MVSLTDFNVFLVLVPETVQCEAFNDTLSLMVNKTDQSSILSMAQMSQEFK